MDHKILYGTRANKKTNKQNKKPAGNCHDSKKDVIGGPFHLKWFLVSNKKSFSQAIIFSCCRARCLDRATLLTVK
jgi:hypothetical protein